MNLNLQKLFSLSYSPAKSDNSIGASSIEGTAQLRENIIKLFKKHGITVYWGGQVPKYSIFSPNSVSPDETYTEVDVTPKSK
jgi:hypothetical protein